MLGTDRLTRSPEFAKVPAPLSAAAVGLAGGQCSEINITPNQLLLEILCKASFCFSSSHDCLQSHVPIKPGSW